MYKFYLGTYFIFFYYLLFTLRLLGMNGIKFQSIVGKEKYTENVAISNKILCPSAESFRFRWNKILITVGTYRRGP